MKLVIEAKTKKGEEALKTFRETLKNPIVNTLAKLKVNVVRDQPFTIICESKYFGDEGDVKKVNINNVYKQLKTFWFPDLKPNVDYIAKAV